MDALKLSQSRLDNLQPHQHRHKRRSRAPASNQAANMETQATVLSSQHLGSGLGGTNAYGSGQFSLVSPPAKPSSIMQHRMSNGSLS